MSETVFGVGQHVGSTYIQEPLDIYASDFHAPPISYMLTSYGLSVDGNGDIIVYEGTVLAASSYESTMMAVADAGALTGTTAVGVLVNRVNLRLGAQAVAVQTRLAYLREAKCRDNGVFGTVRSGSKTNLAALGITFSATDA